MDATAMIMMFIILGITWGGFVATLWVAYLKEQRKKLKK